MAQSRCQEHNLGYPVSRSQLLYDLACHSPRLSWIMFSKDKQLRGMSETGNLWPRNSTFLAWLSPDPAWGCQDLTYGRIMSIRGFPGSRAKGWGWSTPENRAILRTEKSLSINQWGLLNKMF